MLILFYRYLIEMRFLFFLLWFMRRKRLKARIYSNKNNSGGDLQDGGGVRRGDHLPPHKYIKNTSHGELLL